MTADVSGPSSTETRARGAAHCSGFHATVGSRSQRHGSGPRNVGPSSLVLDEDSGPHPHVRVRSGRPETRRSRVSPAPSLPRTVPTVQGPVPPGSLEGGDHIYSSVEAVDEHFARRLLIGDLRGVLDRIVELAEPVEVLSTSSARLRTVLLLDDANEVRVHGVNSRLRDPRGEGPEVPTSVPFDPRPRWFSAPIAAGTRPDRREKVRKYDGMADAAGGEGPVVGASPASRCSRLDSPWSGRDAGRLPAELRPVSSEGQGASGGEP